MDQIRRAYGLEISIGDQLKHILIVLSEISHDPRRAIFYVFTEYRSLARAEPQSQRAPSTSHMRSKSKRLGIIRASSPIPAKYCVKKCV